jgi:hypothetical protein
MVRRLFLPAIATLAVFGLLAAEPVTAQSNRPSCATVMRQVNRQVTEGQGQPVRPRVVARILDTDPLWVRRCMAAYGRVPSQRAATSAEEREAVEMAMEEGRPVELDWENRDLAWESQRQLRMERSQQRLRRKLFAEDRAREKRQHAFDTGSDSFFEMHDY